MEASRNRRIPLMFFGCRLIAFWREREWKKADKNIMYQTKQWQRLKCISHVATIFGQYHHASWVQLKCAFTPINWFSFSALFQMFSLFKLQWINDKHFSNAIFVWSDEHCSYMQLRGEYMKQNNNNGEREKSSKSNFWQNARQPLLRTKWTISFRKLTIQFLG